MTSPAIRRYPTPRFASLPVDIWHRIKAVQEKAGFVPSIFVARARRLAEYRAFSANYDALMENVAPGFSRVEGEMIVVATSTRNQCPLWTLQPHRQHVQHAHQRRVLIDGTSAREK